MDRVKEMKGREREERESERGVRGEREIEGWEGGSKTKNKINSDEVQ